MPAPTDTIPEDEPGPVPRAARVSLRLRVLSWVAAINLVVFGAGLWHLSQKLELQRDLGEQLAGERILDNLRNSIQDGELRVAQILSWPRWDSFSDAVISDLNPFGVRLNPVGSVARDPLFDRAGVEAAMRRAAREHEPVLVEGGSAMAIYDEAGRTWGGVWFRMDEAGDATPLWGSLVPWFFASTLLLYLGTFSVLSRYVLRPVGELARAAGRVRRGDLGVTVALPRHRDELVDLMDTFNHMTAEVKDFHDHLEVEAQEARRAAYEAEAAALRQRRLAAMGELAAGIAHEINNPLGGMLNAVDVLDREEGVGPEKRARYHALLRGGLERIQSTVAGLLRFTPRTAEHQPLSLEDPVRDAIALMRHGAERSGVEVRFEDRAPGARVVGSSSELGQAVLNLLSNALHAIEDRQQQEGDGGGTIEVSLERAGRELSLFVRDDGCGVEEPELERMTDLFFTTKETGRGTGLGLPLVLSVASQHGGRVHLTRRLPRGLEVELALPLAEEGA